MYSTPMATILTFYFQAYLKSTPPPQCEWLVKEIFVFSADKKKNDYNLLQN